MFYGEYRYDKGIVVAFTDKEKPKYEVSSMIDRLTGKRIYSKTSDYLEPGKTVFLYLGGNKYIAFVSGSWGWFRLNKEEYFLWFSYIVEQLYIYDESSY